MLQRKPSSPPLLPPSPLFLFLRMTESIISNDNDDNNSSVSTDSIINIHVNDNIEEFHSDEVQKVTVTKLKSKKRKGCLIICFSIILAILLILGLASFIQIRNFKNRFGSSDEKDFNGNVDFYFNIIKSPDTKKSSDSLPLFGEGESDDDKSAEI